MTKSWKPLEVPSPEDTQQAFDAFAEAVGLKVVKALPPELQAELSRRLASEAPELVEAITRKIQVSRDPEYPKDDHLLGEELLAFYDFCRRIGINVSDYDVGEVFGDLVQKIVETST